MKMFSFLFLSLALHAAALAYPALFVEPKAVTPVIVTVLEAEGGSGNGSAGEAPSRQKRPMRSTRKGAPEKPPEQRAAKAEPIVDEPAQVVKLPKTISTPVVAAEVSGAIVIAARQSDAAGAEKFSSSNGGGAEGAVRASGSGAGNGQGGSGSGGLGTGAGDGRGSGQGRPVSVSASYDYCPRPETPEIARRSKWEGTVTLRVWVDERGNPQSLEVNRSSGFAVLDDAAVENVKRHCHFNPAREGDKRVASWIRIPVVFPLPDEKN